MASIFLCFLLYSSLLFFEFHRYDYEEFTGNMIILVSSREHRKLEWTKVDIIIIDHFIYLLVGRSNFSSSSCWIVFRGFVWNY